MGIGIAGEEDDRLRLLQLAPVDPMGDLVNSGHGHTAGFLKNAQLCN